MAAFIPLAVQLGKGKSVKEALHQYKNVTQNTAIGSIETTIKQFISLAEEKVTKAMADASDLCIDADEVEVTPESIILSTVSGYVPHVLIK
jgi:translation initiation factor 3 subunit A